MTYRRSLLLGTAATMLCGAALAACQPRRISAAEDQPPADIGGPFTLVDADGREVTEAALKGHWSAIYFGFTYCPDVCPTSLFTLKEGLDELGPRGREVQPILISVDPERDTPQVMKAYIETPGFPENLRGFTGTAEQIAAVADAYKIYYRKTEDGLVQHQSFFLLMNPDGEFDRPLPYGLSPTEIATQIGDAMRSRG
jgi:protein SCO1/2